MRVSSFIIQISIVLTAHLVAFVPIYVAFQQWGDTKWVQVLLVAFIIGWTGFLLGSVTRAFEYYKEKNETQRG